MSCTSSSLEQEHFPPEFHLCRPGDGLYPPPWQDMHSCSPSDIKTGNFSLSPGGCKVRYRLPSISPHRLLPDNGCKWPCKWSCTALLIWTKSEHFFFGIKSVFQRVLYAILKLFMGATHVCQTVLQEEAFTIGSTVGTRGWVPSSFVPHCSPERTFPQN